MPTDNNIAAKLLRLEELEQRFAQALHTAKLEAMKELAYGAGHEINNPLANISARAQTLLQEETHPEKRRKLAAIHAQAMRAHEMITDLMLFARPPKLSPAEFDLCDLVRGEVAKLADEARSYRIELTADLPADPLPVTADLTQIRVVVRSLCMNAFEALGSAPHRSQTTNGDRSRTVAISVRHDSANNAAMVIADNGPGIPTEIREKIFDPFFSGREAGRGLGFGLSKCWRIVGLHGGSIDVADSPGGGATFTVRLPVGP